MNPVTLERLRANGSNLGAPHRIMNVFYVPEEFASLELRRKLLALGHDILHESGPEVESEARQWTIESLVIMMPVVESLDALTDACVDLAEIYNGMYDGWYTEVIP
jgi:regulator of RNase E activity RraB